MTTRERKLSILLGGFIAFMVFGVGGYAGVYLPLSEKARAKQSLEAEVADKDAKLRALRKDLERLPATVKRSLPADPDVARTEYDAAINRLLREARVPVAAYSVTPKPADNRSAPEIAPKKPAYSKVALEVKIKPVTYATLIDVLHRYYQLNLLQQITKFNVRKLEGSAAARRGSSVADRNDLDVTFVTEAIILDGAESRRTLLPIPNGMGAVGGAAGYATLFVSPEAARGMTPLQLAPVLATADRNYSLLLVKDIFHGPPPAVVPPPPEKAKEDTSAFIRLTGVGRNPDGTGTAFIEDIASRQEYDVELTRKGDKLVPRVVKHYYTLKGAKRSYEPDPILDISEATSATARKFRVIGLDGDSLVLAEQGGASPARFSGGRSPSRPTTPPAAAAAGAVIAGLPADRILVWHAGEPLSRVKPLSHEEGLKAIQRATALPPLAVPAGPRTVPTAAPPPGQSNNAVWAVTSSAAR